MRVVVVLTPELKERLAKGVDEVDRIEAIAYLWKNQTRQNAAAEECRS